jgi:CHAD domain-containing protein
MRVAQTRALRCFLYCALAERCHCGDERGDEAKSLCMRLDVERIQKSVRRVRKFLAKAPKDPDPDTVHDLRTSARRLEATIETLGLDSKRREKQLLRNLAQLRNQAGKVRDMDVFTGDVLELSCPDDKEKQCLVELAEHLGTKRAKAARKLRRKARELEPLLRPELKRTLKYLSGSVAKERDSSKERITEASSESMTRVIELSSTLRLPARLNRQNLHPYRLKVKELRYILQLADQEHEPTLVKKLGEVKDAIGEWHDWEELVSIAKRILNHGKQCKLIGALKRESEKKFERALCLTNDLRNTYLNSKKPARSARRFTGRPAVSSRVLTAASALSA